MKKFTFLLTMSFIVLFASAQKKSDLQNKMQQAQEKFSKITQKASLLSKLSERIDLYPESFFKSAATKQKLDSTVSRVLNAETLVWKNDYKDEYIYDSELKNTSWLSKEWNLTSKTWDTWDKTELGYDNQKRVNSMLMYSRDSLTHALTKNSKMVVFYNPAGLQDSLLMYSTKNGGVSWILDSKQIYNYNASKQLIKTDMWILDEDLGVLTLSMKTLYAYTVSGRIKSSSTSYIMDTEEILWSKIEYNYDGSGNLISIENSMINFMTLALEKTSRSTYQYNALGDVTVEIYSRWNGTSWDNKDKTASDYNAAGDVSVEIYSVWNGTLWIEEDKDEYTYSTTNFSDVVYPSFIFLYEMNGTNEDFTLNKQITGVNSFEKKNGNWLNTDKTTFYYSSATSTNIVEFGNTLFSVYPNPASEQVNFSWKGNFESLSLEMYLITGAKVMEQITYPGKPVSISKLGNGVYFYKLLNGQRMVYTGKMIKR